MSTDCQWVNQPSTEEIEVQHVLRKYQNNTRARHVVITQALTQLKVRAATQRITVKEVQLAACECKGWIYGPIALVCWN